MVGGCELRAPSNKINAFKNKIVAVGLLVYLIDVLSVYFPFEFLGFCCDCSSP